MLLQPSLYHNLSHNPFQTIEQTRPKKLQSVQQLHVSHLVADCNTYTMFMFVSLTLADCNTSYTMFMFVSLTLADCNTSYTMFMFVSLTLADCNTSYTMFMFVSLIFL